MKKAANIYEYTPTNRGIYQLLSERMRRTTNHKELGLLFLAVISYKKLEQQAPELEWRIQGLTKSIDESFSKMTAYQKLCSNSVSQKPTHLYSYAANEDDLNLITDLKEVISASSSRLETAKKDLTALETEFRNAVKDWATM